MHTEDYTGYVSPYFVISKGKFTKHYFEGAGRIVSKLGNGTFAQPLKLTAGGVNYGKLTAEEQKALDTYVKNLGVPPGPPTQQGIYSTPEFTGDPYPAKPPLGDGGLEENQEPSEGWPRNPVFNALGDVPGPPVQFGPPVEPTTVKPAEGFTGIGLPENDIFYFHPDHLGSTSYITTRNGSISQHVEYIAFGEVLFEEHSSSFSSPYLFNGKELDRETNLSYYGARYLDMKTSLWLSVDPLAEKYAGLGAYTYCHNNPINMIDPRGLTDYKVNGETQTINDGHDNLSIDVTQKQFNRLQRKFDSGGSGYEKYMNRLSYQNGFTTSGTFSDSSSSSGFGVSLTHHKAKSDTYGQWSIGENNQTYGTVEHAVRIADSGLGSVTGQFGNINIGSNGSMYFRQNSGAIFRGNQYVNVTSAASKYSGLVKGAKWGGLVTGVALGVYEVYQGVEQDGGKYGYNAQVQTAGAAGGLIGGYAGAEGGAALGAALGVWFGGVGAVPGAIIGGLIGGATGAWAGDYYGEKGAKAVIK